MISPENKATAPENMVYDAEVNKMLENQSKRRQGSFIM